MAHNDYRGGGSYGNARPQFEDNPPVEIKSFYDADGNVKIELFDSTAKKVAESFVGTNKNGKDIGVSSTQLRRIFDEVKRYKRVLASSNVKWEDQLPYIKMIKSKVAYTVARAAKQKSEEEKVYKNLESFISQGINLVKSQKDYKVFVSLFEAAYGFYYELAPSSAK